MKTSLLGLLILLGVAFHSYAQEIPAKDTRIDDMLHQLSKERLQQDIDKLVAFGTRHTLSDTKSDKRGIGAARRWVKSQLEEYAKASEGRMEVYFDTFTVPADGKRISKDTELKNVVAKLKGTDPNDDRVFIISGHLDSRVTDVMNSTDDAPGANDDGSGVVAMMETARVMAQYKFPATIVFMAVSGEEQGLYGSTHMAKVAKDENWNVVAMLNNDIIGNSSSSDTHIHDNTKLRVFSEATPVDESERAAKLRRYTGSENDGAARELARYAKSVGEKYVDQLDIVMVYRNDRYLRGGDHSPFVEAGFPAVRFCEMNENYDHQHQDIRKEDGKQYGDLPQFMDFDYLLKNTKVNLAILANLAMAPYQPEDVGIDVRNLTNNTQLVWKAPEKGEKSAGYYVLMRETYQPFWQKAFFTTDTTLTVPYSKDNYIFGVQSVDDEGHKSVPVFPMPHWK